MSTNGIDGAFKSGFNVKLQNRGPNSSGITWELKSVFADMAKQGLIRDTDGKGLTKQDALNLYAKLNEMHQETNRATNYTRMQVGQEFEYSADEMKALAQAAGYEIIEQIETPEVSLSEDIEVPEEEITIEDDEIGLNNETLEVETIETSADKEDPVEQPQTGPKEGVNPEYDNAVTYGYKKPSIEDLKQQIKDNKAENKELRQEIRAQRREARIERRQERWSGEKTPSGKDASVNDLDKLNKQPYSMHQSQMKDGKWHNILMQNYIDDNGNLIAQDMLSRFQGVKSAVYFNERREITKSEMKVDDLDNSLTSATKGFNVTLSMINGINLTKKDSIKSSELVDQNGQIIAKYENGKFYNAKGHEISEARVSKLAEKNFGLTLVNHF